MFKTTKYIIYKRDVCIIKEIKKNYLKDKDYYLLVPISDPSLKIEIPTDSKLIRDLITKKEVKDLIKSIPEIQSLDLDSKKIEEAYKQLLQSGTHTDLIKIIKTAYERNKERLDNNKKTTDKDNYYFELAEKYLYNEFKIVLNKDYESTKEYVMSQVEELLK